MLMTQTEFAEYMGISQPRVSKLKSSGKIKPESIVGCKIDSEKAKADLVKNLDRLHNRPGSQKHESKPRISEAKMSQQVISAGTGRMSLADAQRFQAQYKAALLKLEYEKATGKLVDAQQVEMETFNFARRVRDAIQNVPDRISAEIASYTDVHEVREKMTQAYNEVLEELAK